MQVLGGPESGPWSSGHLAFSYEQILEMTKGFCSENIIGEGGFGRVYKGWLPGGKEVAVKELKAGSGQGEREFRAEVEIISRVHHRHLVSLVGYCIADHRRVLIYEFLPNKTLEHHLHGNVSFFVFKLFLFLTYVYACSVYNLILICGLFVSAEC